MCASLLSFIQAGSPPPRVLLLPDALFFVRSVPVVVGPDAAGAPGSAEQVALQVELALEASSPFALPHLYYGHYWAPGSGHAIVFAAYRRRFTAEQTSAWLGAELVIPTFAATLGAAPEPATTVVLSSPEGLTAVHWETGPVPADVWFQPIPPEATDEERASARADLLRRRESLKIVDLASPPAAEARRGDGEIVFRSGDFLSRLPAESAGGLDVRDKAELAALRRGRARDVALWRIGIGCVAFIGILALAELALFGGGLWQQARRVKFNAQEPVVAGIMTRQEISDRINDLSTKRLLPIEMIQAVWPSVLIPQSTIYFTQVSTTGLHTLTVEAQTSNAGEIKGYQNKLESMPECASVAIKDQRSRDNMTTFTLVVTFKPDALKPLAPAS
jgi:hypothetical protein